MGEQALQAAPTSLMQILRAFRFNPLRTQGFSSY
jgi:hypothetical protein